MKIRLSSLKSYIIIASTACSLTALTPAAHASSNEAAQKTAVGYILLLIDSLMSIFFYAGLVLLVWSVISFIIAFKNEDADSKVQAISQIAVAIVCVTLSGTLNALMVAAGVKT